MSERSDLEAAVESARVEMERRRAAAMASDRGESVTSRPPCPLPDNKAGFRVFLAESWTGQHRPSPAGYREFVAYLDAIRSLGAARWRLESFDRQARRGATP